MTWYFGLGVLVLVVVVPLLAGAIIRWADGEDKP